MVNKKKKIKKKDAKLEKGKNKTSVSLETKTTDDQETSPEEAKALKEVKNSLIEEAKDEEKAQNKKEEKDQDKEVIKISLIEEAKDKEKDQNKKSKDKELSFNKQKALKKSLFKETLSRIKNFRPTIEDVGLICGFITIIICSVFIVINIIRKEKIIVWIILLCSGLIPLSLCLDDKKQRRLEEKLNQETSRNQETSQQQETKHPLNAQNKKQDKTSHSKKTTQKKSK